MINRHGFDESCWGILAQWQTLNPPAREQRFSMYAGYERLGWHPYGDLPRLPLNERFQSFAERLERAKAKRLVH